MRDTRSGIYRIVVKRPGKPDKFYIGQASDFSNRKYSHFGLLRKGEHKNTLLQNAFNKYGEVAFSFHPVLVCERDRATLATYEQIVLDLYVERGVYNICKECSISHLGVHRSEESRERMSVSHIGKSLQESHKKNIGAAHLGQKRSSAAKATMSAAQSQRMQNEEERQKLSAARKGMQFSDEHRLNLSIAHLGNKSACGRVVPEHERRATSAKLVGRKRSPDAIAKQRATIAARKENSIDHAVKE